MKKKVKDLTLSEVQAFCVKCETCLDCPLYNLDYDYICKILPNEYDEDVLNQEVEVADE